MDEVYEFRLTSGDLCLIDACDRHLLGRYKWGKHHKGYAFRNHHITKHQNKHVILHRLILGLKPGEQVDHRNGNKLDNRRSNLRIASLETQARNKPKHKGFSRFKGVTRVLRITGKSGGRPWRAQINLDGRIQYLGNFKTDREAHQAYVKALCEHHGTTLKEWKREHPNCGF